MTQPNPEIDWSRVPQTIDEYAKVTGAPMHRVMPDDHPLRPSYHGEGFSFPPLPEPSHQEERVFRYVDPLTSEKYLRIYAMQIQEKYGQIIVHEIIAATYDGNITPEDVFGYDLPKTDTTTDVTDLVQAELSNQPHPSEYEGRSLWWRNRRFLAVSGAFSAVSMAGVMLLPPYVEQSSCDRNSSNSIEC